VKTFLNRATRIAVTLLIPVIDCFAQGYVQTNLVSNTPGVARDTDPSLVNSWGLSRSSSSPWWVSDFGKGVSTLYDGAGAKRSLVVTIPPADPTDKNTPTGNPTGGIFNGSKTDFLLAPGQPANFLFATGDGTIAGWNPNVAVAQGAAPPSTHAVTVVNKKDGSGYTGLTSALIEGQRYLYAANFNKGTVDVFDGQFRPVKLKEKQIHRNRHEDEHSYSDNEPFMDDSLPPDFVPFNVQAIGNNIVVTYVLHQKGQMFETDGPGLGYVDIFSSSGRLLQRLEHGDWLNAPWGVALAPLDFGRFSHCLLVAQFAGAGTTESSGYIAAYDVTTGRFEGLLEDANGKPLAIPGIWSISPGNVSPNNSDAAASPAAQLYFTAGPDQGTGGLMGYLTPVTTQLVQGNDQ
jgi:uncharacterized protein (TIGR03118 family)